MRCFGSLAAAQHDDIVIQWNTCISRMIYDKNLSKLTRTCPNYLWLLFVYTRFWISQLNSHFFFWVLPKCYPLCKCTDFSDRCYYLVALQISFRATSYPYMNQPKQNVEMKNEISLYEVYNWEMKWAYFFFQSMYIYFV